MFKTLLKIAVGLTAVAIIAESVSESIKESENEEHKVVATVKKIPFHAAIKIVGPVSDKASRLYDWLFEIIDKWRCAGCETA